MQLACKQFTEQTNKQTNKQKTVYNSGSCIKVLKSSAH